MSFPRPAEAPFTAVSCRILNGKDRSLLLGRISHLTAKYKIPRKPGHQAAATIYLGLCYLRDCQEAGTQQGARSEFKRADSLFLPEHGGSQGTNCSHYSAGEKGESKYLNHRPAIDAAMGVFLPEIKALKRKCFLLMELGSRHGLEVDSPADESWLTTYVFEPFDFDD